jgi:hypothetical protein
LAGGQRLTVTDEVTVRLAVFDALALARQGAR